MRIHNVMFGVDAGFQRVALKRHSPQLTEDKLEHLVDQLHSESGTLKEVAISHLVHLTHDPANARAVVRLSRRDAVIKICSDSLATQAQADALSVLISLLDVPEVRRTILIELTNFVCVHKGADILYGHADIVALGDYVVKILQIPAKKESDTATKFEATTFLNSLLELGEYEDDHGEDRLRFEDIFCKNTSLAMDMLIGIITLAKDISSPKSNEPFVAIEKFSHMGSLDISGLPCSFIVDLQVVLIAGILQNNIAGRCALALGNFMSRFRESFCPVLFRGGRAASLATHLALAFGFGPPDRKETSSRMLYVIDLLLEVKGSLITQHKYAEHIVARTIDCLDDATESDQEALGVIWSILVSAPHLVLSGSNVEHILTIVAQLLSAEIQDSSLNETCCMLLEALINTSHVSALLACVDPFRKIVALLSNTVYGRELLLDLMPVLQWHPWVSQELSLEFKREWVSAAIQKSANADNRAIQMTVRRGQLLEGICDRLEESAALLRNGIQVQFDGNGENGLGDGHRREFFRLTSEELTNVDAGLFRSNDGGRSLHISSTAEHAQPDNMAQFELCGKLIGLALLHGETLPAMRYHHPKLRDRKGCSISYHGFHRRQSA